MIKTIEIKTLEDAMQILLHQTYNEEIGRLRSDYLYRGMPDKNFKLTTSLRLNCGDKQCELESSMLKYFAKYAAQEDPKFNTSVWRQMSTGQHYGLPTRLLDWSHSPLIAMHFSTSEKDMSMTDKRDGVIWRIDEREFTELLPDRYRARLAQDHTDVFSIDSLNDVVKNTAQYDEDMGNSAMAIIEPYSFDQRIINQYSYFMMVPMGIADIEDFLDNNTQTTVKFIIDKDIRWKLRDVLDQCNISERSIYPGLDGLTRWIARHYYVQGDRAYSE